MLNQHDRRTCVHGNDALLYSDPYRPINRIGRDSIECVHNVHRPLTIFIGMHYRMFCGITLQLHGIVFRSSHLRRAIFSPSKWTLLLGSVRAISDPPSCQTANRRRPCLAATLPHMTRLWPANLMRYGPFLARLV